MTIYSRISSYIYGSQNFLTYDKKPPIFLPFVMFVISDSVEFRIRGVSAQRGSKLPSKTGNETRGRSRIHRDRRLYRTLIGFLPSLVGEAEEEQA
jgi:hypothetical protein